MSYIVQPLTAIERARIAYEQMMQQKRESAMLRQAHLRARNIRLATCLAASLTALVGLVIYYDLLPASLRSASFGRDAAAARFVDSRTGQVRTMIKGNDCQELHFSNDRGAFVSGNIVPCQVEVRKPAVPSSKGARMNSIRDAFAR